MIGALCRHLNAADVLAPGTRLTGGLVLGLDSDPAAKVTQILFDASGEPQVVAKVARLPAAEEALRAEHRMLVELAGGTLENVSAQLPRPLLLDRVGSRLVLATNVLPGGPMAAGYYRPGHVQDRGLVAQDLSVAGDWLAAFQRETHRGRMVVGPETVDEWVLPVFRRYRDLVGWSRWERELLDSLARACEELSGLSMPLTAEHGDYAIGNILLTDGVITGVVDWERGRPVGLPCQDVFKLVASYGSFLDRAAAARRGRVPGHPGWSEANRRWGGPGTWPNRVGFLHAFFGAGWFPDLVRQFVGEHLLRLGAPAKAMELFLPLFVAEQATALDNPVYRSGYRSVLEVMARGVGGERLPGLEAVR